MKRVGHFMKKEKKMYVTLVLFGLLLAILSIRLGYLYGSTTDFVNQHMTFAEYFRDLFYQTGSFNNQFSLALGAGQNIFNFAYYGLFNPLILIGYFMPRVSMTSYLIVLNILLLPIDGVLLFTFLKSKTKKQEHAFLATLFFMVATPLLFQMHRQIMFVDYLPFLLLGLLSVDYYFKTKKRIPIILSVFLLCLTSFYYSVGSILVIFIYSIYSFVKEKKSRGEILSLIFSCGLGVLLACFLLLPVLAAMLTGRSGTTSISLLNLLIPNFQLTNFLYDAYGLGLTLVSLIAIGVVLVKNKSKESRILTISLVVIFLIPLFLYLLNGTLYVRSKVLIPFLPLISLILLDFIDNYIKDINLRAVTFFVLVLGGVSLIYKEYGLNIILIFILDIVLTLITLYLVKKKQSIAYLSILFVLAFGLTVFTSRTDKLVSNDTYQKLLEDSFSQLEDSGYRMKDLENPIYSVNKIYNEYYKTTSVYSSTVNPLYYNFYKNYFALAQSERSNLILSSSPNLLFDAFMGVKYVKTNHVGQYQNKLSKDMVENEVVFPLFYVTSNVLSEDTFDKLSYPNNSEAMLKKTIIKDTDNDDISLAIEEVFPAISLLPNSFIKSFIKEDGTLVLDVTKDTTTTITFQDDYRDKILFFDFLITNDVSCKEKDRSITIGNIKNTLSCSDWLYYNNNERFHYVLSDKGANNSFSVSLSKGVYEIKDWHTYLWDSNDFSKTVENKNEVKMDFTTLSGKVDVVEDGYFVSSIPYDEGFTIYIDGVEVPKEIVNKAFLGSKITKGHHEIKLVYDAPYFKEGKIISLVTLVIIISIGIYDFHKKKLVK